MALKPGLAFNALSCVPRRPFTFLVAVGHPVHNQRLLPAPPAACPHPKGMPAWETPTLRRHSPRLWEWGAALHVASPRSAWGLDLNLTEGRGTSAQKRKPVPSDLPSPRDPQGACGLGTVRTQLGVHSRSPLDRGEAEAQRGRMWTAGVKVCGSGRETPGARGASRVLAGGGGPGRSSALKCSPPGFRAAPSPGAA